MKCPDCDGKGRFAGIVHCDLIDGSSRNECGEISCKRCEATGEVPNETQKWIDIGRRMREERLKRKEVQRVAAKRMGLTLKEYSDMEKGRIKNDNL